MAGIPFDGKSVKVHLCQFYCCGLVDSFEISGYFFALFPGDVVQAVSYHMNNTELNLSLWKDRLYRLGKTLETIYTGNKNVFHTPIFQFSNNLKPELGSLVFSSPHAED